MVNLEYLVDLKTDLQSRNITVLEFRVLVNHLREIDALVREIRNEIGINSITNLRGQTDT
jgi:hypothetical protein